MSSILASNGMVLATAMAAVSGTVILLAFRLQKSFPTTTTEFTINPIPHSPPQASPRPCISSDGKKREKKKKKVHFAEDVMDPSGDGEEFRRRQHSKNFQIQSKNSVKDGNGDGGKVREIMPANRMALYSGILRDRVGVVHRPAYSY